METERTKISIVNNALVMHLGMPGTFSDSGDGDYDEHVDAVWPNVIARCFGLEDWSFCRKTAKLTRRDAEPENGWRYGFNLPGDRLGEPSKYLSDPQSNEPYRDFDLEGNEVYCDIDQLWCRYKVALEPKKWDSAFADAFIVALGSGLAVPIKQDMDLKAELKVEAFGRNSDYIGGLFGRLIAQNTSAKPRANSLFRNDPLTSSHGGGTW